MIRGTCVALLLSVSAMAGADGIKLEFLAKGAMPKLGGYSPVRLELSDKQPDFVKKLPDGVTHPLFGVIKLGEGAGQTSHVVVVEEPTGAPSKLFVDTNGNGDLTDDPATEWTARKYPGAAAGESYTQYMGGSMMTVMVSGKSVPAHFGMYRFDPADSRRAALKNVLLYYADYAYEGEVELGGKKFKAMLADDRSAGSFAGELPKDPSKPTPSGVRLLIDVNNNGKFERRGEEYDARKPFNIAGTTYELTAPRPDGSGIKVITSKVQVAEVLPLPDFSAGKPALAFNRPTTSGKNVSFPGDYKGKIVMLDFWATWCGPCIAELPNLIAAYEKYHSQGFEVLGISLDQANASTKLADFTKERKMPWSQVYDGKFWQAEVAQMYGIESIPSAFLVDGNTGKIIATTSALRGAALVPTLEKALKELKP